MLLTRFCVILSYYECTTFIVSDFDKQGDFDGIRRKVEAPHFLCSLSLQNELCSPSEHMNKDTNCTAIFSRPATLSSCYLRASKLHDCKHIYICAHICAYMHVGFVVIYHKMIDAFSANSMRAIVAVAEPRLM